MTFAAKVGKDETITISAQLDTYLTITNIALAPKQSRASLYLREKQSNNFILIVELEKERLKSYNCNIRLHLNKDQSEQIFSESGETNIIGNLDLVQKTHPKIQVKITRNNQRLNKKIKPQESKTQTRPERTVTFNKKEAVQPKTTDRKKDNNKKQKSLLQMMKNIDKEDSDESDDQSYEQQSESQQSDDSQSEEQQKEAPKQTKKTSQNVQKNRNKKKKISWAQMLLKEHQSSSDQDKSKEQSESEEQLDDKTPEVQPNKQKNRQIPALSDELKVFKEETKQKQTKKITSIAHNGDSDSSSFQFTVPKGLPSFLKKQ